jgi:hypothetical protein
VVDQFSSEAYRADEWMDANHRLMKVWTEHSQRWMSNMLTGETTVDKPPVFDDIMGMTGKLIALNEAFTSLLRETGRYQAFFLPVWYDIWQRFLQAPETGAKPPGSFEESMNYWFTFANTELIALQNSEEYLEVNQRIGQALTQFKTCQRKLTEHLLTRMDIPTQQEVDSLGRTLFELKREVRRLKEERRQHKAQSDATVAPVVKPARKKRQTS